MLQCSSATRPSTRLQCTMLIYQEGRALRRARPLLDNTTLYNIVECSWKYWYSSKKKKLSLQCVKDEPQNKTVTSVTRWKGVQQVLADWQDEARPQDIKSNLEVMTEARTDDLNHELMTHDLFHRCPRTGKMQQVYTYIKNEFRICVRMCWCTYIHVSREWGSLYKDFSVGQTFVHTEVCRKYTKISARGTPVYFRGNM